CGAALTNWEEQRRRSQRAMELAYPQPDAPTQPGQSLTPAETKAAPLITAARKRHEVTRAKATQTLRELDRTGAPVSFEGVARRAGVSRSWLYTQPDIRAEIERLRDTDRRSSSPPIPTVRRSSEALIRAYLEAALKRNRQLAEENQRLRRRLARIASALGDQRASSTHPLPPPSPAHRSSVMIGLR
ncbi:transposase, partial [Streptomyces sp. NBRC 110611]|uniref:DUF6262 family protein n=1 Tax=Streptomyces sp. NBRC 110611 TaxID=1621259 RepID=UPI000857F350